MRSSASDGSALATEPSSPWRSEIGITSTDAPPEDSPLLIGLGFSFRIKQLLTLTGGTAFLHTHLFLYALLAALLNQSF